MPHSFTIPKTNAGRAYQISDFRKLKKSARAVDIGLSWLKFNFVFKQ